MLALEYYIAHMWAVLSLYGNNGSCCVCRPTVRLLIHPASCPQVGGLTLQCVLSTSLGMTRTTPKLRTAKGVNVVRLPIHPAKRKRNERENCHSNLPFLCIYYPAGMNKVGSNNPFCQSVVRLSVHCKILQAGWLRRSLAPHSTQTTNIFFCT